MPGTAGVKADGVFRGGFGLNLPLIGDTLVIPLGADNRVRVMAKQREADSSVRGLGMKRVALQAFDLVVVNEHDWPVSVKLSGQIPIANTEDISVESTSLDGGLLDPVTGEVQWFMTLQPGETATRDLQYTITYPRRRTLRGL
jgi:hypothetical protein